ncbi:DUF3572 domain-containing protein [Actibacterium sp.]|uniref:DUF3572 domain-containing protein n=1 Tax=Actibacterium sp. TaxID=1872125 RepID=UPI003567DD25
MRQDEAETIAIQALAWLAEQEDLLGAFLGASGASPADLATQAASAEFQIALLDFLMMDDAWVIGFCQTVGQPYETVMQARQSLPGGAQMHWT